MAEFGDSRILVYMPLAERRWAMKSRAICMGIIILVAIVVFCVTPYSYWNADKMLYGALYCNLAVVMISILILYLFNRNDVKAVAKTIFISLSTYSNTCGLFSVSIWPHLLSAFIGHADLVGWR
ncbi:MAG: hypothetical protein V8Q54_06315 [Alistipes senegalensis]